MPSLLVPEPPPPVPVMVTAPVPVPVTALLINTPKLLPEAVLPPPVPVMSMVPLPVTAAPLMTLAPQAPLLFWLTAPLALPTKLRLPPVTLAPVPETRTPMM